MGEVPELTPYYESASVFVAPLFVRGGLKFKVPQAMLCGLPVVATHVAVEGISDVAPTGVLWAVTDDPNEMASSVVAAIRDEVAAAEVGEAASEWCREFFSFGASIARLVEVYSVLANGTSRGMSRDPEQINRALIVHVTSLGASGVLHAAEREPAPAACAR